MLDPKAKVYQGQAGTGRAWMAPDEGGDPFDIVAGRFAAEEEQQFKQREAQKAQKRTEIDAKFETGYNPDYAFLSQVQKDFRAKTQELAMQYYAETGSWDFNMPGSSTYFEFQSAMDEAEHLHSRSAKDSEYIANIKALIDKEGDSFTPEGLEAFYNWTELPPQERLRTPRPNMERYWDVAGFQKKTLDTYIEENTKAWSAFSDKGVTSGEIESVDASQLKDVGHQMLMVEPRYRNYIDGLIRDLSPEEREAQVQKAAAEGFNSLREYYSYDMIRSKAYTRVKSRKSMGGAAYMGASLKDEAAQYMIDWGVGVFTGTSPDYKSIEPYMSRNIPEEQKRQIAQRYKIMPETPAHILEKGKDQFGQNVVENLGGVIYDKETGQFAIVTKNEIQQGINPASLDWTDKDSGFGKYLVPISENMKDVEMGNLVRIAREKGIIMPTGAVKMDVPDVNTGRVKFDDIDEDDIL